jgi:hypothetical protein
MKTTRIQFPTEIRNRCVVHDLETLVVHLEGKQSNVAIELHIKQNRQRFAHSEPIVSLSLSSSHRHTEFRANYGALRVTAAGRERERERARDMMSTAGP